MREMGYVLHRNGRLASFLFLNRYTVRVTVYGRPRPKDRPMIGDNRPQLTRPRRMSEEEGKALYFELKDRGWM